ncbi:hypothetical protein TRFO_05455 [Tritrichomonas foetus]|uniref:USP domain-containing protein n=1 Tax=Tritrichomonas foetus TaxID=1144522 RepID=A0A1J4K5N9_9EUKA|nr:hypothetical protein TRFO_05455 [Tritrichomonas foetus]|eukprot:OHT06769.1 hypothetical protein TRFO_05455 [Tritrichomonas foetus]
MSILKPQIARKFAKCINPLSDEDKEQLKSMVEESLKIMLDTNYLEYNVVPKVLGFKPIPLACFVNVIIHCLLSDHRFLEIVMYTHTDKNTSESLLASFKMLALSNQYTKEKTVDITDVYNFIVSAKPDIFPKGEIGEASMFYKQCIDMLREEILTTPNANLQLFEKIFYKQSYEFFSCPVCKANTSTTPVIQSSIDLLITVKETTLQAAIKKHVAEVKKELLQECEYCHKTKITNAQLTYMATKFQPEPELLVFTFSWDPNKGRPKIKYPYLLPPIQHFSELTYTLKSVICYTGNNDNGHFDCYSFAGINWYYLDGKNVRKITDIKDIFRPSRVTMLFYQQNEIMNPDSDSDDDDDEPIVPIPHLSDDDNIDTNLLQNQPQETEEEDIAAFIEKTLSDTEAKEEGNVISVEKGCIVPPPSDIFAYADEEDNK